MSEVLQTTDKAHITKWWTGFITPQTVMYLLVGVVAVVTFWNTQKNTTADVDVIKKEMPTKVDISDFNSLLDRVTRQYETNNKILDRIITLEKQQEYQRGISDAKKDVQTKK